MAEHIQVTLDDQGRLVLPPPLQRRLGLEAGMTLVVEQDTPDAAYLRVQDAKPSVVDRDGVLVVRSQPSGALEDVMRLEGDRRTADWVRRAGV